MALMEILEFPDPRLRTIAKAVETFDEALADLVRDMLETMYNEKGIGLAATQVDVHQQVLVMDTSDSREEARVYINPKIIEADGHQVYEEGCLSVPGIYANVERAESIRVEAQGVDGERFEATLDGLDAVCLQHEMDHLQGKLFVDYLSPLKRQMVRKKLEKARRQAVPAGGA
ncbi:peptide deformylase [Marinihelvus fidelis]|uniref:Peptide deformylase n=1 Tax=Marinihelvus fidelis TaxID=2613842 RepID=A0A5N0T8R4_9GAMM|nr:peptide deformylase [Marinihelvus fidelis]KAA9131322.1 peptide deformylase [Marinihelvus fidelis]